MNKIGFQNFRRFLDFKPIEYRGITFLVGRNNAGKSTLVKALLLINKYLKSDDLSAFSFGNEVLEDANIVTFGRAQNHHAEDDKISFTQVIEGCEIEVVIVGNKNATVADIYTFKIRDLQNPFEIELRPIINEIILSYSTSSLTAVETEEVVNIQKLDNAIKALRALIDSGNYKKSSKLYLETVDSIGSIEKKKEDYLKSKKEKGEKADYYLTSTYRSRISFSEIVEEFVAEKLQQQTVAFNKIQEGQDAPKDYEDLRAFKEDAAKVERSFKEIFEKVKCASLYYMGANPAKQSALFNIRDKNNALAQAIHDFYQLRITAGEPAYEFVEKWMKEFEIGNSFEIELFAGEAYQVIISSHDTEMLLADKGMGSIQAMLLILRLASVIRKCDNLKSKKTNDTIGKFNRPTIVIEEPELNLHPALQSRLADLFLEVYLRFGIKFIVETHSEYILRRSQVMVAEKEFEIAPNENPFCVYYFPKDPNHQPYQLNYLPDGVFDKNFGEGFFDEASASTLRLLRLKREKKE